MCCLNDPIQMSSFLWGICMFSKHVLFAIVFCLVGGCSPVRPSAVPQSTIVALMGCVVRMKCLTPGKQEKVGKERIFKSTFSDEKKKITYFFTDEARFGVTIAVSATEQILLEDEDLDGLVDKITVTNPKDPTSVAVYGREKKKAWLAAQLRYVEAMKIAEEKVIPSVLLHPERWKDKGPIAI